jgi:hypothetical protein
MIETLPQVWRRLVPQYKSVSFRNFVTSFQWDSTIVDFMYEVSENRCERRKANYIIPGEFKRSKGALRFGVKKEGHGYHGRERGDFCMVGASFVKGKLHVFYRRVELIGGLHYDLVVFNEIEKAMGPIKTVTIMAAEACAFCVKKNSNEKLYKQITNFYDKRSA